MLSFREWLKENSNEVNKIIKLPFPKLMKALNQYCIDSKYTDSDVIVKKGSKYIIDDVDNMDNFGLAKYDEDGNYQNTYDLKTAKKFVEMSVKSLSDDEDNFNDFKNLL